MRTFVTLLIMTGALAACATSSLTPELRRRAAATPILTAEQVGARRFTILDEVVGRSCARGTGSNPSIDIAREELKVRAAALGADAVTSALCEDAGIDIVRSCSETIVCRGDAIRWAAS